MWDRGLAFKMRPPTEMQTGEARSRGAPAFRRRDDVSYFIQDLGFSSSCSLAAPGAGAGIRCEHLIYF